MSDIQHYPLVTVTNRLPARVDKQLALTEKILANRKGAVFQPVNVFHVPRDGTIKEGVAKIAPGGTISIAKGEYVLGKSLLIEKPPRLEGAGMEETIMK